MALITNELFSKSSRGPLPRIQPAAGPGSVVVKEFATVGANATYQPGTPVAVNGSGQMVLLAPAGTLHGSVGDTSAELLYGIVWPAAVAVNTSTEVLGTVMLKGSIHYDDLQGVTFNSNLQLALRHPKVRFRGLFIEGLTDAT